MSIPTTMQAARIDRQGGPDELRLQTLPVPRPGPGQVLIRVESAAVNFADVKRRRGDAYPFPTPLPFVPGSEVAGTVAALGEGVAGPAPGSPVFSLAGLDGSGGYAQFVLAPAVQVLPLPPGLDADRASTLTVAGSTAMLLLTQAARLQAGESVLVSAAAGGVGSFVVPLARRLGAGLVIGAVGHADKAAAVLGCGAHVVVDSTRADWAQQVRRATDGRGVDVVLEAAGGDALAAALSCLAPFGRAVIYGAASGRPGRLDGALFDHLFHDPAPNPTLIGFNLGLWFQQRPQAAVAALGELIGAVAAGALAAPPLRTLSLAEAALAHRLLESRQTVGKLVLKPWG